MSMPSQGSPHPRVVVASSGPRACDEGIEIWAADLGRALWERKVPVVLCKGAGVAEAEYERVIPCWRRDEARTKTLLRWLPTRLTWRVVARSAYRYRAGDVRVRASELSSPPPPRIFVTCRIRVWPAFFSAPPDWASSGPRPSSRTAPKKSDAFLSSIRFVQQLAPWHLEQSQRAGIAKPTWTAIPNFVDTPLALQAWQFRGDASGVAFRPPPW